MNIKTLPIMGVKCMLIMFLLGIAGCVKEVQEPSPEFDVAGDVFALVSPDTVQIGQPFRVQMSFPAICGGTFSHFQHSDSSGMVRLTPVIHVVVQKGCAGNGFIETETTEVKLDTLGSYLLVANGQFGQLSKIIQVVPIASPHQNYILHYLFVDLQQLPKPAQSATFIFPDRTPPQAFVIQSNSYGIWDTTFSDTSSRLRYTIDGIAFQADRGIKENGVILYQ